MNRIVHVHKPLEKTHHIHKVVGQGGNIGYHFYSVEWTITFDGRGDSYGYILFYDKPIEITYSDKLPSMKPLYSMKKRLQKRALMAVFQ